MSRQEGRVVVRPFEYCLERSRLALADKLIPELRQEIIHSELSPDKAWREAKRRLNNEDETLATSYWWLAKTGRDHRERFEKEIKQEGKEEMKKKGLPFAVEVELPKSAEIRVFPVTFQTGFSAKLKISGVGAGDDTAKMCEELLSQLIKADPKDFDWREPISPEGPHLKDLMVKILEDKFGFKVKTCVNCKYFEARPDGFHTVVDHRAVVHKDCDACLKDDVGLRKDSLIIKRGDCWTAKNFGKKIKGSFGEKNLYKTCQ